MGTIRTRLLQSVVIAALAALSPATRAADLDLSNPQEVARLQADLASPEFPVRDGAQKRLTTVPRDQVQVLSRIAAAATDPEVKARLNARVDELQELIETDPPDLPFHVKDVDLAALAAAFTATTHTPFDLTTVTGRVMVPGGGGKYTLQTDALPFWKIYQDLNRQDSFFFYIGNDAVGLLRGKPQWNQLQHHRGFAVFAMNPEPIGMNKYKIYLNLGFDPRLDIATVGTAAFDVLRDDLEKHWPNDAPAIGGFPGRMIVKQQYLMVTAPEGAGKKLTVAGAWPVQIAEEWKSIVLSDLTKPPAEKLVFGNSEFQVQQLENVVDSTGTKLLHISLECSTLFGQPLLPDPRRMIRSSIVYKDPQMELTLQDANGQVLLTHRLGLIMGDTTLGTEVPLPEKAAKMVLRYPVKLRDYKVPFEFKDLPVPP